MPRSSVYDQNENCWSKAHSAPVVSARHRGFPPSVVLVPYRGGSRTALAPQPSESGARPPSGLGRGRGQDPLSVTQRLDAVLRPFVAGQVTDVAVGIGPVN